MSNLRIDNPDIIPIALDDLGGAGRFVDVEDLFMRCYEIAPERFGWRKHKIPNYKILSKALRDFEEKHPDLLIKPPDGLKRQLSAEGIKWLRRRMPAYRKVLGSSRKPPPSRRPSQRILNELSRDPLFVSYSSGADFTFDKYRVADMLLCSPDSPIAVWRERLETFKSAAEDSNREDLVKFLDALAGSHPGWFGEGNDG